MSSKEPNIKITQVGENAPVTISQRIVQHWPLVMLALAAIIGLVIVVALLAPTGGQGLGSEAESAASAASGPLASPIIPAASPASGRVGEPPPTAANTTPPTPVAVRTSPPSLAPSSKLPSVYSLKANVNPLEGGLVQGAGTFAKDSLATLQATPNPGWTFQRWSGDASGKENPLQVVMDGAKAVTANFVPAAVALVLSDPEIRGGVVTINGTVSPPESWVRLRTDWGDGKVSDGTFPISHKYDKPDEYTVRVKALAPERQAVATATVNISLLVKEGYYKVHAKGQLLWKPIAIGSFEVEGVEIASDRFRIYSVTLVSNINCCYSGVYLCNFIGACRERGFLSAESFVQDNYGNTYPTVQSGGDYDTSAPPNFQENRKYVGWVEYRGRLPLDAQLSVRSANLILPIQFSLER